MATTFSWIYLGTIATQIDPTEGNADAENAAQLVGQTYGSTSAPLYQHVTSATSVNIGGSADLDTNNSAANDRFTTDIGAGVQTFTFDAVAGYNATLTYADGTTATFTAVIVQSTSGELFLAPEISGNEDTAVLEARPIASLRLDSVQLATAVNLAADRYVTGFDDGYVEGTAGNDLINAAYVEPVAHGSDRIDNGDAGLPWQSGNDDHIRAGAGNDTVEAGAGNDVVYGGTGNDSVAGGEGNDLLYGEDGDDSIHAGAGADSLFGGAGADTLESGSGDDLVSGGAGDDLINVNATDGADTIDGGEGTDTLAFYDNGSDEGILLSYSGGADGTYYRIDDGATGSFAGIEVVRGTSVGDKVDGSLATADLALYGGSGNDTLSGGAGSDSLYGGEGNDAILAMAGDDLSAASGVDLIDAGSGNDSIHVGDLGTATVDGGADFDALFFDTNGEAGVELALDASGSGTYNFGAGSGTFINIEEFGATDNDDSLDLGAATEGLRVLTRDGNDTIFGGAGNDTLVMGAGDDLAEAGDGDDSIQGDNGDDLLAGDGGNDTLSGDSGADTLLGGEGDDSLSGGEGDDQLFGEEGNDTLDGGLGNDVLYGGGGKDLIYAGEGEDEIGGGSGNDTVLGGAGADTIGGDEGDDSLSGGAGDDVIDGGQGADLIEGGEGDDILYGGSSTPVANSDPASYAALSGSAGTLAGTDGNSALTYTTTSLETGATSDGVADPGTLTVQASDGSYYELQGYQLGDADEPNETHLHEFGQQTGSVQIRFAALNATETLAVSIDGWQVSVADLIASGRASFEATSSGYTLTEDGTILGADSTLDAVQPAVLTIYGPLNSVALQNISGSGVSGGMVYEIYADTNPAWNAEADGDDTIYGGYGRDAIYGGAGDVVDGGEGGDDYDTLYVEDVDSVAYDAGNSENGTVHFSDGSTLTFSNIENVVVSGAESGSDGVVSGTDGNDMIDAAYIGDPDGDVVDADGGSDDVIDAGAGDDTIVAGAGDDTLRGGAGNDELYGGIGADLAQGGAGNDTLYGGAGADTLQGGADADVIYGGAGDVVDGGEGGEDTDTLYATGVYTVAFDPENPEDGTITFVDNSTLTFSNIEKLILNGGNGDGLIYGTDGAELITPGYVDENGDIVDGGDAVFPGDGPDDDGIFALGGDDTVEGGAGDDDIFGGTGNDLIYGGAGNDSILGNGPDYQVGDVDDDTIYGGAGDDYLRGDAGNDSVFGGEGNDSVYGGYGDDTIFGGAGNDEMYGGYDDDTIYGGEGNDTITGSGENDLIYGEEGDDSIQGSFGRDTIYGGAGADLIYGEDDADDIYAGAGDYVDGGETVSEGGADQDTLHVSNVASVIFSDETGENGTVWFNDGGSLDFFNIETVVADGVVVVPGGEAGSDGVVTGTAGDDLIDAGYTGDPDGDRIDAGDATGVEGTTGDGDVIEAGAGNDTILAGAGDDVVRGGAGNDTIYGGSGNDTIDGGAGDDSIRVEDAGGTYAGGYDSDTFTVEPGAGYGAHIDGNEDPDNGEIDTLDLTGAGPLRIIYDETNPENGTIEFLDADGNVAGSMTFSNIENVVPCFTPGTLIQTDRGEVPVEDLAEGDMVLTRDDGFQALRWIGRRDLSAAELAAEPRFVPVRIAQGALGQGLPERDMSVSPQHRMLMTGSTLEILFGEHEVLVPAVHLVGQPGITRAFGPQVSYIHLLFDRHQIVCADGAWSESFQPGAMSLGGMDRAQRDEVLALFPELALEGFGAYPAARLSLKAYETKVLLSA